jgi:hypothetical protein
MAMLLGPAMVLDGLAPRSSSSHVQAFCRHMIDAFILKSSATPQHHI